MSEGTFINLKGKLTNRFSYSEGLITRYIEIQEEVKDKRKKLASFGKFEYDYMGDNKSYYEYWRLRQDLRKSIYQMHRLGILVRQEMIAIEKELKEETE